MSKPVGSARSITRRVVLALPLALLPGRAPKVVRAQSGELERELIARSVREGGLSAPLTLGIARVVLRPGASSWAETPNGVRIIVVESGVLGVSAEASSGKAITATELAVSSVPPNPDDELLLPAGTTMTFGARGVASVRNPGSRSVVMLEAVVFQEEPRPLARTFTTESGVSFQLLASASADSAPVGPLEVTLERVRLGQDRALPEDLSHGLTLMYVEAGTMTLLSRLGSVFSARAAASAPYAMPGSLESLANGEKTAMTAGGVVYLPAQSVVNVTNVSERPAVAMTLALRETA
jgi:hypothetical protein